MQRSNLSGWILMAVLFIAAMSLIFYILLMRAQHFARMEEDRNQPGSRVERVETAQRPLVVVQRTTSEAEPTLAYLVFDEAA